MPWIVVHFAVTNLLASQVIVERDKVHGLTSL